MNPVPNPAKTEDAARAKRLGELLGQSEDVKVLVEGCATDLLLVNEAIWHELANGSSLPKVELALRKSVAIADKVQEASDKLSVLNRAFLDAIRDRDMLHHQFAAAVEQAEAARHAALHETLTGLPNRALFNDRLEHALAQARRHGWSLAVMFIDLDQFKKINTSYGHGAGDSVLQAIGRRLAENTRGDDTVSRHGGDEFLYLAQEIRHEEDIAMIAEKIIGSIKVPCHFSVRDQDISLSVTASIGIAVYPKDGDTAAMLVNRADKAMFRAKKNDSGYSFAV